MKKLLVFMSVAILSILLLASCGTKEYTDDTTGLKYTKNEDGGLTVSVADAGKLNSYCGGENGDGKDSEGGKIVLEIPKEYDGIAVTEIAASAFSDTGIIRVTISESIKKIGTFAFRDCAKLEEINVKEGNSAYAADGKILYSKDGTKLTLVQYAVANKDTSLYIGGDVVEIAPYAVYGAKNLKSVDFTSDILGTIGNSAFAGCTSLQSLDIKNGKTVGASAFFGCTALTSVTVGGNVDTIGEHAFFDCTSLESVTLSDKVNKIRDYAFDGCTSLTTINTAGVNSIGIAAFRRCAKLERVDIAAEATVKCDAFNGCYNVKVYVNAAEGANKNLKDGWNNTLIKEAVHYN